MKDFPKGGLIGKTLEGARMISAMHIPFRAAYGAYFLILSLFPALLLANTQSPPHPKRTHARVMQQPRPSRSPPRPSPTPP